MRPAPLILAIALAVGAAVGALAISGSQASLVDSIKSLARLGKDAVVVDNGTVVLTVDESSYVPNKYEKMGKVIYFATAEGGCIKASSQGYPAALLFTSEKIPVTDIAGGDVGVSRVEIEARLKAEPGAKGWINVGLAGYYGVKYGVLIQFNPEAKYISAFPSHASWGTAAFLEPADPTQWFTVKVSMAADGKASQVTIQQGNESASGIGYGSKLWLPSQGKVWVFATGGITGSVCIDYVKVTFYLAPKQAIQP